MGSLDCNQGESFVSLMTHALCQAALPLATTHCLSIQTSSIEQPLCLNINQQLFLFSFAAQSTLEVIVLLVFCHDVQFLLLILAGCIGKCYTIRHKPKSCFFNIYKIYICTLTCKSISRKQGSGAACFCKRTPKGIVREDILFRESKD